MQKFGNSPQVDSTRDGSARDGATSTTKSHACKKAKYKPEKVHFNEEDADEAVEDDLFECLNPVSADGPRYSSPPPYIQKLEIFNKPIEIH